MQFSWPVGHAASEVGGGEGAGFQSFTLYRKAREAHLIDKAMTLAPHGVSRHDELS